jgi:hypothetical protein
MPISSAINCSDAGIRNVSYRPKYRTFKSPEVIQITGGLKASADLSILWAVRNCLFGSVEKHINDLKS